ncbi:type II secretion system F family protein [Cytophagales bacterium LB-30]|uniref:General secretion pathway protein F n=1 Tax=Shiella aurantiaca TaxID=3058365 RepID=A0ABT8F9H4_9BACT|nr:type II secretion system F family protein [Shiella aurantiaca]MDN4167087.1 type II secretion system F family protein [Shiella aurantiaca]
MALRIPSNSPSIAPSKRVEPNKSWLSREIRLGSISKKIGDKEKETFYLEMSTLFSSGVDIRTCLDLISEESGKPYYRSIIQGIKEKIIHGASLSEAMQQSGAFSAYEYFSVQIGEETGNLIKVFDQIASFYSKKIKQRRQLIGALSYPILVLSSSVLAVGFMLYFIVPMFAEIFKRFGGELPFITQQIIAASKWLESNGIFILMLLVALTMLLLLLRKNKRFVNTLTLGLIRVPLLGRLYTEANLARFCSSMSLLIGAKIPLIRAIQLVEQMIEFYPIKHSLAQVEEDILRGKSLHQSFSQFSIFDGRMITLLKIGEEVNKLDVFFGKLSQNYSEAVDHRTQLLSTFLEPLIIVLLGLIVGFILVAMYLPMFQLSGGIG